MLPKWIDENHVKGKRTSAINLDTWIASGEPERIHISRTYEGNEGFEKVLDFLNALSKLNPIERESLFYQLSGLTTRETEKELKRYFKRTSYVSISRKLKTATRTINIIAPEFGRNMRDLLGPK